MGSRMWSGTFSMAVWAHKQINGERTALTWCFSSAQTTKCIHTHTFMHWWQGCHAGRQPSHQEQIGVKHLATHRHGLEEVVYLLSWVLFWSYFLFYCDWLVIYLSYFHGNTFGEIPLDVFKVHLCSAACYMWQLRNQRHITHQYKQLRSLTKMKWFFLKQMFWQERSNWRDLDFMMKTLTFISLFQTHYLQAPVVRPHLILNPVFFKDVNGLQER